MFINNSYEYNYCLHVINFDLDNDINDVSDNEIIDGAWSVSLENILIQKFHQRR